MNLLSCLLPNDLKHLTAAYNILDQGYFQEITSLEQQGKLLACRKGCSMCCSVQVDITVLELKGMLYCFEHELSPAMREQILSQLKSNQQLSHCPFLWKSACSIYPMRPFICRSYWVTDKVCQPNVEHSSQTIVPTPFAYYQAVMKILPLFGVNKESDQIKAMEHQFILSKLKILKTMDFSILTDLLDDKRIWDDKWMNTKVGLIFNTGIFSFRDT